MKKILVLFIATLAFMSCAFTPSQKAEKLAQEETKKFLVKPDSYDPIETKVDSAFSPFNDIKVMDMLKEVANLGDKVSLLAEEVQKEQSEMSLYSGPYMTDYTRTQYNQAKSKYELAKSQGEKLYPQLQAKLKEFYGMLHKEPEFVGYIVTHSYRAESNNGNVDVSKVYFLVEPNGEKVIQALNSFEYELIQAKLKEFAEGLAPSAWGE